MPRASIPEPASATGRDFPDITVSDIVGTQRLLLDSLGIEKLVAIVGPSYGGFQAFQWAVDYPDAMKGIAPSSPRRACRAERSDGNVARLHRPRCRRIRTGTAATITTAAACCRA